MCAQNPRNCSLRDEHAGPCVGVLELNKTVEKLTGELMRDLGELEAPREGA